jgi:hypothetical protein
VDGKIWRAEADVQASAEFPGLKLIVRRSDTCARYVILRRTGYGGTCTEVMLSSGTEPNVEAAMAAAKKVATRIDAMLAERRRSSDHVSTDRQSHGGLNGQPLDRRR